MSDPALPASLSGSPTPDAIPPRTPRLRKWSWPPIQSYNGFTSTERIRGWQLTSLFVDLGLLTKPTHCSITGSQNSVSFHDENYYEPWKPHPISRSAHAILHQRFRHPLSWQRLVAEHTVTGEEWFCKLKLEPVDMAAELRATHGLDIADIFARAPLPAGMVVPRGQIYDAPRAE